MSPYTDRLYNDISNEENDYEQLTLSKSLAPWVFDFGFLA